MRIPSAEDETDSYSNSLWDVPMGHHNGFHLHYDSTPPTSESQEVNVLARPTPRRPSTPQPPVMHQNLSFQQPSQIFLPRAFRPFVVNSSAVPSTSNGSRTSNGNRTDTRNSDEIRRYQNNVTPTTSRQTTSPSREQPLPTEQDFLPVISINVPSRRTHRRLVRRAPYTTWYGASSLSQSSRDNTATSNEAEQETPRNPYMSRDHTVDERRVYPQRQSSPSRIPRLLLMNPLFDGNITDNDEIEVADYSYMGESNPEVARFIHPGISIFEGSSSPQPDPHVIPPTEERILLDRPASPHLLIEMATTSTQTDPTDIECAVDPDQAISDTGCETSIADDLEFDDSHDLLICRGDLGDILHFDQRECTEESLSIFSYNQHSDSSSEGDDKDSAFSANGLSALSRLSRVTDDDYQVYQSSDSDDSSDKDTIISPTPDDDANDNVNTPESEPEDTSEEFPGPSTPHPDSDTSEATPMNEVQSDQHQAENEIKAQIVINDEVVLKNGTCKISFGSLLPDDLRNLLNQTVTVKIETIDSEAVLKLDISSNVDECVLTDCPKPIYRQISRYLGGSVQAGHIRRVSFNNNLVDERVFEVEKSLSSSWEAEAVQFDSTDNSNDSDSEIPEIEDFEVT